MKVTINPQPPPRRLVAVVSSLHNGMYVRNINNPDKSVWIGSMGMGSLCDQASLEELVKDHSRQPVYEGDEVTLKF